MDMLLSLYLEPKIYWILKEASEKRAMSVSEYIRELISEALQKEAESSHGKDPLKKSAN